MTSPEPPELPEGWMRDHPDLFPGAAHYGYYDDRIDVEVDAESALITWTETRDDHYGTTTRAVRIPSALLRALLAVT